MRGHREDMAGHQRGDVKDARMFLVCDTCGTRCCVTGHLARAVAKDPPACPGCGRLTRVARDEVFSGSMGRRAS
jgi:hypothetical protein